MVRKQTLSNLVNKLKNKVIPDVLANEVYQTVVDVESKNVQKTVYNAYSPLVYKRRGENGGLADPKNHVATFSYAGNMVTMAVRNTTKGQDGFGYLSGLIEYGHDAGYGQYDYPYSSVQVPTFLAPRPFISSTKAELERTLAHLTAMKAGMRNRGIKVK
ncbi:hypothetical protein GCM10008931_42760 [Oceanobacillus oncorhynchi subsp. oncorhynchi]|uniref:hypothetical protein n=1 Tax=Oceanobacillus oncorhynchi TaxID=545501 RepID=UPI0031D9A99F